jgi:hypothetical protein
MDRVLDRYLDMTATAFLYNAYRGQKFWNSESFLIGLLRDRYHICFESNLDIVIVLIRLASHGTADSIENRIVVSNRSDWTVMA